MEEERGMKKAHEKTLRVEGCSTPGHGPERSCWKVIDEDGGRPIQGVTKEVADLYAAVPDMVRALLGTLQRDAAGHIPSVDDLDAARAALTKAGVQFP
jgi:hypothetical protein